MLTYVKRNLQGIEVEERQDLLICSPDSLVVKLKSSKVLLIYMINQYNGSKRCLREGKAISAIYNSALLIRKRTL